jgi:AraC-like DNA-binding protein
VVPALAPRIRRELLEAIVRHDDESRPIAETCRRVGDDADRLGFTRPSYQRIRELVHRSRRLRRYQPSTLSVLVDVAMRVRPPEAFINHISGISVPVRGP